MNKNEPNILVYNPEQAEEYAECIRGYGLSSVQTAANPEEAKQHLPSTEIILGWKFPTSLLSQPISSSVRWFQSIGAGIDDLMRDKTIPENIAITRILNQFGTQISEYVFTFLLHIVKDVERMRQAQSNGRWDPFISECLAGKTIGVAGIGSIGSEIIRKARAFDMNVHGLSFSGKQAHLVDSHFNTDEWDEFVKELDYLVLTLPLTEETRHIIKKDTLLKMKKDACLINVGRGALIDEQDLLAVLQSGHLQAAVLDVFETEPLPKDHPFFSMSNVYVTPHLSGPSTINGVSRFFAENVERYLEERPLNGLVDRKRGY
jgi:glyoxylate/hydroxypyruvate reductase